MVVLTTCGNDEDAGALARALVERRLAACVNAVSKVASTYRWKGEVQQDQETLLIIKTTPSGSPPSSRRSARSRSTSCPSSSRCPSRQAERTTSPGSGNRLPS